MVLRLKFLIYYIQKRGGVLLGFHRTRNPLSLRWRWEYWVNNQDKFQEEKKRKKKLTLPKSETDQSV
jgi:hypothetical protein